MYSQKKKRKTATTKNPLLKPSLTPESTQILSLPDDLVLSCLAHVSKLYYPTLSLVSKSFRSLLTSQELHETRSLLNRTESCLFVCFQFSLESCSWFTLCRKPNRNLDNDKKKKKWSSGYFFTPIPIINSHQARWENPVIDNVRYSYRNRVDLKGIIWYDSNIRQWTKLKGLDRMLPKIPKYSCVKLVDYGGKIAVLWDKNVLSSGRGYQNKKMIWCAVIALERRNNEKIWGKIEWIDGVLTLPLSFEYLGAVAANV